MADSPINVAASGLSRVFQCQRSRAFCQSTVDWRLLHYIAEQASFILLDREDAEVVALGEQVIEKERAETEAKRIARNIIERRASR